VHKLEAPSGEMNSKSSKNKFFSLQFAEGTLPISGTLDGKNRVFLELLVSIFMLYLKLIIT
jgi:hypothetical protein